MNLHSETICAEPAIQRSKTINEKESPTVTPQRFQRTENIVTQEGTGLVRAGSGAGIKKFINMPAKPLIETSIARR